MKKYYFILPIFFTLLFATSSCVETVKQNPFQAVHIFTDLPDSLVKPVFSLFEKRTKIHVYLHCAGSKDILNKLKTEKWQSKADVVILKNALDLIELKDEKILQKTSLNFTSEYWQPLFHDPFVFYFPNDSLPLFTNYGQLLRHKSVKVDASKINSFEQWGNLIPSLKKNYRVFSLEQIQEKILYSDTARNIKIPIVQIATFSHFSDKKNLSFPDQYFKGSIGIIGGIAIIRQSKNRSNAEVLYQYCQQNSWRTKLAKRINLFPILDSKSNQSRDVLLYQSPPNLKEIKNSAD